MLMYTGKEIHSYDWVELPIDYKFVKRVDEVEKIEKQPTFDQYPMFECAPLILNVDDIIGNEEKGCDEENPEYEFVE